MQGLTLTSFGMIWITLTLISFGQIFLKLGIGKEHIPLGKSPLHTFLNILMAMFKPKVVIGLLLYVIGTFFWLMVLSRVPLSVAFPLFSMSYFLVVILSATILRERVIWRFAVIGLVLISIGVTFIGFSSPEKRKHESNHAVARNPALCSIPSARLHLPLAVHLHRGCPAAGRLSGPDVAVEHRR